MQASGNVTLGDGGYGTVYKASLKGIDVAIKVQSADSQQGEREFSKEVEILGSTNTCCPSWAAVLKSKLSYTLSCKEAA